MVREGNVDIIAGDWLSEMNIAWNAIAKAQDPSLGYEGGFFDQLSECIEDVATRGIKVVTNAGALNPTALSQKVIELCKARGLEQLIVATVLGDDVSHLLPGAGSEEPALRFRHLDDEGRSLDTWDQDLHPSCAVAYMGCWGIVAALSAGADIVICGRVTDASPVIGAAAWWYGWSPTSYPELAGALIAGHVIECGPYAVGANYSGFKEHIDQLVDVGFPIAEIQSDGTFFVTKPPTMNGVVTKHNIIAQILYELQGELYLNPDVVADLSSISVSNTSAPNRVFVSGMAGLLPPPTTKVMIAAPGGYQAEATYYLNGLDIPSKRTMMERQLRHALRDHRFSKLSIELYGSPFSPSPRSQQEGTVMLRVFAQSRRKADIEAAKFKIPIYALRMQSYPGYHMNLDFRTMDPKPFMEIFPSVIEQKCLRHRVVIGDEIIPVPPPGETKVYPTARRSYDAADPVDVDTAFGPTVDAPLGYVVHARSGDKANNSNVGFFVRHEDEYPWLKSLLSTRKLKDLLEEDYKGQKVERVELPAILAVHL